MRRIITSLGAARAAASSFAGFTMVCFSVLLLTTARASATPIYHDVDAHFAPHFGSNFIEDPTNPHLWHYHVVVSSDQTYSNVSLVFPFAYQINLLPPSTTQQTIFPWNDTTHEWENGLNSIAIYGVSSQNLLTQMSDTDIPLIDSQPPITGFPASIQTTDMVPRIFLGAFSAGVQRNVDFDVLTGLPSIKHQVSGFYVVDTSAPVPEPSGFALLLGGATALLGCAAIRRGKIGGILLKNSLRAAARHVKSA